MGGTVEVYPAFPDARHVPPRIHFGPFYNLILCLVTIGMIKGRIFMSGVFGADCSRKCRERRRSRVFVGPVFYAVCNLISVKFTFV